MPAIEDQNKDMIRRYGEVHYNQWEESLAQELVHPDVQGEFPGFDPAGGMKNYLIWYRSLRSAFPDCHFAIDWILAEGEFVAVRWDYRATHAGEFMGIPPTGRRIELKYNSIYRIRDGKIIDIRSETDTLKLLLQLGAELPK
jgi:predicted ester cyclase